MIKKFVFILIAVVLAVEGYFLFQTYRGGSKKYTGSTEKIVLGVEKSLLPSLVWIAENKGYFAANGIEVEMKEFDSGRAAFTAMLNEGGPALSEVEGLDMVTVAQTPVMFNSFNRNDFAIVAAMVSSYNDVHVLGRRDRGITKPADLRGKKIGVTMGSTGQYFLGLFLNNAGIGLSEVKLVDIKTGELAKSLQEGTVDAISTWQPNLYNAEKALGDQGITFPPRKIFREDFYFVPNRNFLQTHPEAITRFLQAVSQAEDFIKNDVDLDNDEDKDRSVDIVSQRLGLDRAFVASVWSDFQFGLFLDNTVIKTIEDEAQWAIENKLTDKTTVPNYLDYISLDALKKVAPEKVQIKK